MTKLSSQDEVLRFLMEHGEGAGETVTTHISIVVLTKERAFKLKRDVVFPYLDFSSPQRRLAMCEREFDLNRRTAPALYVAVRRITRGGNGTLCFDGEGDLVDAIVEMRRFEQEELFDRLSLRGALTVPMIEKLSGRIAAFHDTAPVDRNRGGLAAMIALPDLGERSLMASTRILAGSDLSAVLDHLRETTLHFGPLLDARRDKGRVRRCHGDLILRNICLFDGEPTPFDCLEFSDDLATIDVLYDLAFLLMDLWHRDQRRFANLALNRYLDLRDETDGLPLLPYFMAMRAVIRAEITATQNLQADADHAIFEKEVRDYFNLASSLLHPGITPLIAIGGLSGTGKSSVAAQLAPLLGAAPGARILNSDRLRKKLFSVPPQTRLPQEAYTADISRRVYEMVQREAERVVSAKWPVIVDAVFAQPSERQAIEALARQEKIPFVGFWLEASPALCAQRVGKRLNDVSDATQEVLLRQRDHDAGDLSWMRIDASRAPETIAREIAERVAGSF